MNETCQRYKIALQCTLVCSIAGKIVLAACFVNDLATVLALGLREHMRFAVKNGFQLAAIAGDALARIITEF